MAAVTYVYQNKIHIDCGDNGPFSSAVSMPKIACLLLTRRLRRTALSQSSFMINYRVADLRGLLMALREEGWEVLEKVEKSESVNSAG